MSLHPPLKWSQKKDQLTVKVELRDVTDEKISFTENKYLDISCTSGGRKYEEHIELFEEIDGEVDFSDVRNRSSRKLDSPLKSF